MSHTIGSIIRHCRTIFGDRKLNYKNSDANKFKFRTTQLITKENRNIGTVKRKLVGAGRAST
jgi:hypothetical protein